MGGLTHHSAPSTQPRAWLRAGFPDGVGEGLNQRRDGDAEQSLGPPAFVWCVFFWVRCQSLPRKASEQSQTAGMSQATCRLVLNPQVTYRQPRMGCCPREPRRPLPPPGSQGLQLTVAGSRRESPKAESP